MLFYNSFQIYGLLFSNINIFIIVPGSRRMFNYK